MEYLVLAAVKLVSVYVSTWASTYAKINISWPYFGRYDPQDQEQHVRSQAHTSDCRPSVRPTFRFFCDRSSPTCQSTVAVLNQLQFDFNLLSVQITDQVQILVDFNLRVGPGKPAIPMNARAIKCQISSWQAEPQKLLVFTFPGDARAVHPILEESSSLQDIITRPLW
jgi:hypothetical protein